MNMREVWKKFKCLKCGETLKIEINVPYVGWRCLSCDFAHMFEKGHKEIVCSTLEEVKE